MFYVSRIAYTSQFIPMVESHQQRKLNGVPCMPRVRASGSLTPWVHLTPGLSENMEAAKRAPDSYLNRHVHYGVVIVVHFYIVDC